MKILCGFVPGLLAILTAHAAEIVAWKVPLSRYGVDLQSPGVVRCKDAPETSPFFKHGDELWDLKKAISQESGNRKIALDWLVWNANSRRLVAKGNWWDLCMIHKIIGSPSLPVQCRVITSVFEVPPDGAPLSEASKPVSEAAVIFRSGQKSTAFWDGAGKFMDLDLEGTINEAEDLADIRFKGQIGVPGQLPLKVETAFSCEDGKSLWIARDFDGKKGLDVRITATVELLDGSPFRDRVMIQKGDMESPISPDRRKVERQSIGEKGWLVSLPLDPASLGGFLTPEAGETSSDPFKETSPNDSPDLPLADSVQPPEFLRERLTHEILDAHDWITHNIPDLAGESGFAGYDPIEERMYFFSPNRSAADIVSETFSSFCCCRGPTIISTLDGLGQIRLIGKSGQKATLTRSLDAKTNTLFLEIEPTVGESADLVDFRFDFQSKQESQSVIRINSSVILEAGISNVLFSYADGDTAKAAATMKIEISQIGR